MCYLVQGVKQKLFAGWIRHPQKTGAEFLTEATTIEKVLEVCTGQYSRQGLTPLCAIQALCYDDLQETIRVIVCEEQCIIATSGGVGH